jgi:hypothetical protein
MVGPNSNAETRVVPAKILGRVKFAAGEVQWVNSEVRIPIPMGRGEESAWGGLGLVVFPYG